mgnify:FL=1
MVSVVNHMIPIESMQISTSLIIVLLLCFLIDYFAHKAYRLWAQHASASASLYNEIKIYQMKVLPANAIYMDDII